MVAPCDIFGRFGPFSAGGAGALAVPTSRWSRGVAHGDSVTGWLGVPCRSQVVFERALGIARNSVVLPVGYALASSSVSGEVMQLPSGQVKISFVNWHAHPAVSGNGGGGVVWLGRRAPVRLETCQRFGRSFLADVLTEIYLCHVCSCQEILGSGLAPTAPQSTTS
jgi:hypothetical protein